MNILWEIVNEMPDLTNEQLVEIKAWERYVISYWECWRSWEKYCCGSTSTTLMITVTWCQTWGIVEDTDWILVDLNWNTVASWTITSSNNVITLNLEPWYYVFITADNSSYQPFDSTLFFVIDEVNKEFCLEFKG